MNTFGILVIGKPGVGKSTLALDLVKQGHALVADDIVKCYSLDSGLFGELHNLDFKGKLHIRGDGIVDICNLHNHPSVSKSRVDVCVSIGNQGSYESFKTICNVKIPFYNISTGKPSAIYSIIQELLIS